MSSNPKLLNQLMINFENISLSFSGETVLEDLSFTIGKGTNVCLSGPSGSGKSSILKLIQGYLVPDKGHITIDDMIVNPPNIKDVRQKMAYIPQNVNLPVENGDALLKMIGATDQEDAALFYLEQLGLSQSFMRRGFDAMSGGQKQRIIVSVCLALGREIVLLDEPTSSLDDVSVDRLVRVVGELKYTTLVSASHDQKWVASTEKVIPL